MSEVLSFAVSERVKNKIKRRKKRVIIFILSPGVCCSHVIDVDFCKKLANIFYHDDHEVHEGFINTIKGD